MSKPVLYRTQPRRGKTYVLTEVAHAILLRAGQHIAAGNNINTFDKEALQQAGSGCFTFIDELKYHGSDVMRLVYTAGYGLLDRSRKVFELRHVDYNDLYIPDYFYNGDLELFREFSIQGWGPKTKRFVGMVEALESRPAA